MLIKAIAENVAESGYDWWDLVPAIVGGVLGALAGGIPAWLLARRSSRETLARDQQVRQDAELAAAFRMSTKMSMMMNDLSSTLLQIRGMLARSVNSRDESPVQRRVSAFAGAQLAPDSMFTADELALFIAAGEGDYLSQLDLFGRRYVADIRSLMTYGDLKADLHELFSSSPDLQFGGGDTVVTASNGPLANKMRMKARTLESVIVPLIGMIERDVRHGAVLGEQFAPKLKKQFPDRKVPGFDFSELRALLPDLFVETDGTDDGAVELGST